MVEEGATFIDTGTFRFDDRKKNHHRRTVQACTRTSEAQIIHTPTGTSYSAIPSPVLLWPQFYV
jgi:hypothetical protein